MHVCRTMSEETTTESPIPLNLLQVFSGVAGAERCLYMRHSGAPLMLEASATAEQYNVISSANYVPPPEASVRAYSHFGNRVLLVQQRGGPTQLQRKFARTLVSLEAAGAIVTVPKAASRGVIMRSEWAHLWRKALQCATCKEVFSSWTAVCMHTRKNHASSCSFSCVFCPSTSREHFPFKRLCSHIKTFHASHHASADALGVLPSFDDKPEHSATCAPCTQKFGVVYDFLTPGHLREHEKCYHTGAAANFPPAAPVGPAPRPSADPKLRVRASVYCRDSGAPLILRKRSEGFEPVSGVEARTLCGMGYKVRSHFAQSVSVFVCGREKPRSIWLGRAKEMHLSGALWELESSGKISTLLDREGTSPKPSDWLKQYWKQCCQCTKCAGFCKSVELWQRHFSSSSIPCVALGSGTRKCIPKIHRQQLHGRGFLTCVECNQIYVLLKPLRRHCRTVHGNATPAGECQHCGNTSLSTQSFARHSARAHGMTPCPDPFCSHALKPMSSENFKAHLGQEHPTACLACTQTFEVLYRFSSCDALKAHLSEEHGTPCSADTGMPSRRSTEAIASAMDVVEGVPESDDDCGESVLVIDTDYEDV